ncbi:MAG: hypothetical protein M3Q88_04550 [Pseudomonadota bacterium]|nr:hypothetical protein [Pseudomonadota bacterium]
MLGLFAGPRVASRVRNRTLTLIFAASLSTLACGPRGGDKLDDNELAGAEGGASSASAARCTARTVQDEVKRQLFARAAEIRGGNGDDYASIAEFAVLQLDGMMPSGAVKSIDCTGRATLRLPAGLRVAGGRTTLGGDIGYNVSAGVRGDVTLGLSDSIAVPLATLTQVRAASSAPVPSREPVAIPSERSAPEPSSDPVEQPKPVRAPTPAPDVARPSFNCSAARTRGERAVCGNPSLAALDREMAAQYRTAVANGGPDDRRLLAQTRDRFLGFRDRCGSDACIANTYRGRMREIDDIVAGRWQPPR